jgi:tetratricopeptide (TPR) repeat protein
LNTVEDKVIKYLQSSSVPETRVEEFLNDQRQEVMVARGDWFSALETLQGVLRDLQDKGNKQALIKNNYDLARNILEIDRFGYSIDLSGAESALLENIELSQIAWNSRFCLAIVYIRQGRLNDARDHYDQANKLHPQTQYWITYTRAIRSEIQYEMASAEGRWDEAIAVCESSIDSYQRGGYRWKWARKLIDLGDALSSRNVPGDQDSARESYQQSLDMFTEMGAPGYIQVLEERLAGIRY